MVFTLVLFLAMRPGWELPGRIPREYVLIVGSALLALLRLSKGRRTPLTAQPSLMAFAFMAFGAAGLLVVPPTARLDLLWALAPLAALWALGVFAARSVGAPAGHAMAERGLVLGVTIACAIAGALALAQSYLGFDLLPQVKQPAATFMQRNVLAQALVPSIPMAITAALLARSSAWRWLAYGSAALGSAALVATRTRGAWIAFACALVLALVLSLMRRPRIARHAAVGLALVLLVAIVPGIVDPPEERRLPSVTRAIELLAYEGESSVTTRGALFANTLMMSTDSPLLGHGAGRFGPVYPLYHDASRPTPGFGLEKRPEHAHNEFLHACAELGVPAALILALFLGGALVRALRDALREVRGDVALWQSAAATALLGVLVHAQGSFPLRSPVSAFLAFALAGVAWRPRPPKGQGSPRRWLCAETLLLVGLLPALAAIPYDAVRQEALGHALERYAEGDGAGALAEARAPSQHPFRARTRGLATMIVFESDKDVQRTLPTLEAALAADPHNLNLLLATGARRLKAGRASDALAAFEHALAIDASIGRAWLGKAMSELERGERDEASRACLRALLADPPPEAAELFCFGNRLVPAGHKPDLY